MEFGDHGIMSFTRRTQSTNWSLSVVSVIHSYSFAYAFEMLLNSQVGQPTPNRNVSFCLYLWCVLGLRSALLQPKYHSTISFQFTHRLMACRLCSLIVAYIYEYLFAATQQHEWNENVPLPMHRFCRWMRLCTSKTVFERGHWEFKQQSIQMTNDMSDYWWLLTNEWKINW